jgi:hypothetical protein
VSARIAPAAVAAVNVFGTAIAQAGWCSSSHPRSAVFCP